MTSAEAERWVTISALATAGIYGYRRVSGPVTDPSVKALLGTSQGVPPLGTFVTAWAVTFLIVSVMATASPGFGGAFAILVGTADFIANAPALFTSPGGLVPQAESKTTPQKTQPSQPLAQALVSS